METALLKALIKESIREVLREESLSIIKTSIPYVSDEEQTEINTQFGSPSDYENQELIDMTEWVKNGDKI